MAEKTSEEQERDEGKACRSELFLPVTLLLSYLLSLFRLEPRRHHLNVPLRSASAGF